MTPDSLIRELAIIVEATCVPVYNRDTGLQEPLTREQWLSFKDSVDLLCAAYTPREVVNDERKSVRQQQA